MPKFASAMFNWLARPSGAKRAVEIDLRLDVRYAFPRSLFIHGHTIYSILAIGHNNIIYRFALRLIES